MKTKEINYRNGLLTFQIPASWSEEYEEDGSGVFYEDVEGSGTLRVDVATVQAPEEPTWEAVSELLAGVADVEPHECEPLPGGAFLAEAVEDAEEEGEAVQLHWWYVASPLPPRHVRVAVFSYTVARERAQHQQTVTDLAFLEQMVRQLKFSGKLLPDEED